ncbi:MAG: PQQ-dependent sugar dehydrogenase [Saprospiraceae bacterium]|nr:PQQ-dependent sugar dehydrogenase [Saprospiraceae bacterium]
MYRLFYLLIITALSCNLDADKRQLINSDQKHDHEKGAVVFKTHCAGCHGADLQGALAPGLIRDDWKYGRTKGLMVRNVTYGISGTDMAAFRTILSPEEIEKVVEFVINRQVISPTNEVPIPRLVTTKTYDLDIEEIVGEGLETPWAIEFVDANTALISERSGSLHWLRDGRLDDNVVEGTPLTHLGSSTGGYMDIALDPNYDSNGWIYLSFSFCRSGYSSADAPATTKIVRGKISTNQWIEEQTLFEAPDSLWVKGGNRWGCRMLFDDEGHLLFTIGDMGKDADSQDFSKVTGKIFRINPNGSIPDDNPFTGRARILTTIYTLGNRNVQGLSIHPETREIWATEHGPMGGDELNIIRPGANYGWPVVTYGVNYDGAVVSNRTTQNDMESPVYHWTPSIGICPIEFVESEMFSDWSNNLLIGSLAFEQIIRCKIQDHQVVDQEIILQGVGRVRDIKTAPDGSIYIVLNRPDKILRLSVAAPVVN